MKKASLTVTLLTASGLAGATTTTTAMWPDASILSIVAPPDDRHLTGKDPEPCYSEDLAPYFDVPFGPHSMVMAQISYAQASRDPACMTRNAYDSHDDELCPPLGKDFWCGFAAAPEAAGVLPAYSAYGSSASAWWQARSASAVALARRCPVNWWWAAVDVDAGRYPADRTPVGSAILNGILIDARCYAEAHATVPGDPAAPAATSGPEATPGSGTAPGAAATGGATQPENGALGRGDSIGVWKAWGLAAVAVTSVW